MKVTFAICLVVWPIQAAPAPPSLVLEKERWAGPTCQQSGLGCSERERAYLYHWMAKQVPFVQAEIDRLVSSRGASEEVDMPSPPEQWIDQRLHILDQLASPIKDEL
jgi:mannitol-1-phosphate/altronate dehydrogenase